jgi:hypothetical protein
MKNLIRTLIIFGVIALLTIFVFSIEGNTNTSNNVCTGFDVTVIGSSGGFTISIYQGGNEMSPTCWTGQNGYNCCVNMALMSPGYYDVCADNGSCQGCTYNVYWPGLTDAAIPVTVDVRAGCYK